jgi:transcriptional regulator
MEQCNMYVPLPYQENRQDVLIEAIKARSFGTLITTYDQKIHVSHIPFVVRIVDGQLKLIGHLARNNPQMHSLTGAPDAVATFVLDDAYISPGWYPSKQETGRAVPTWAYIAVEARGPVELIEAPDKILEIVDALTTHHEAARKEPWSSKDAPADYIDALLKGIIGLVMHPHTITGAWKLDQKRSLADRQGAALGLRRDDSDPEMAVRICDI